LIVILINYLIEKRKVNQLLELTDLIVDLI
jgi:hypothetical protein